MQVYAKEQSLQGPRAPSSPKETLEMLKAQLGAHFKKESLSFSFAFQRPATVPLTPTLVPASSPIEATPRFDIPKGGLTEISGAGKTRLVLRFLAQHPHARVAWLEPRLSVYPIGFLEHGVSLHRILFSETGDQLIWSLFQVLKSQLFPIVIAQSLEGITLRDLRRLQLEAERAQTCLIFLSPTPRQRENWPFSLQLQTRQQPDTPPVLLKARRGG